MLDKVIKFSIHNKLVIGVMTLVLIVWGVWSATKLAIDAVPDITNNQVQIITACPTLAGQEVEQFVTFPIEQSIANVPNVEEIRSISRFGLSVITVVFEDDVDVYFARQLINERIAEVKESLPKNVSSPELGPVSTGLGEVYQYILHPVAGSEANYNAKDLRTMQDWIVARQLYGIPGVAEVNSFGGELKQYEVAVDPVRLMSFNVNITDVFNALERNNENTGGAYIDKKPNAYFIRGVGLITSLEDIGNIAIQGTKSKVPIFIKDIAEVRYGSAIRYGALTFNGEVDAVGGIVMMLKGENSNDVVKRVKERIPIIQKSLPDDIIIEAYLDRTELVDRAISTVQRNLIEGALIVIFVLVLFLGNLRAGLIVASAIPLSLLFALGMMRVFGVSANLMSLGAIDFGLIVDGAVIIVEATLHHLGLRQSTNRLTQAEMDKEVYHSASKIRSSAAFGEIIILIVYLPILSLTGVEGKMFTPMAQTVSFAILGAFILSMTYIPMMSALFLSKNKQVKATFSDKMIAKLNKIYEPILKKALKLKVIIVSSTVVVFTFSIFLFTKMGGEFIPQLQEGDFAFHCILPQGSSLSQSIETSMQASKILKSFDEVKMVVGKTGSAEVPTDPMPPEGTDLMIILKPHKEWASGLSYTELASAMMERLEVIPGVFFESNQPIQMRFNELMTGIRQDVAVKIFGENMDTLANYAKKVGQIISTVSGTSEPQIEQVSGLPQINVNYNRRNLGFYGVSVDEVNDVLSTAFAGKKAGQVFENERKFDLVVRLDSSHRTDISDVQNLLITTEAGQQVPLNQLATVNYELGPAQISREEGKRRIVIGFNVVGKDIQSVVKDIEQELNAKVKLPSGYYFSYGGQFENLQKATNRLLVAVPLSLLLIFSLLYFTFHSVKQAVLIFTAIPMSAIGGIFALLARDMPFSISAGIGFIALFGVAVLNGIVLIGTFNDLKKEGMADIYQRVVEGTKIRLRPVLMTATVASLGFLPMAISTGAGAEVQKPLATVVIGGLITATLLTLFVLPILYILFSGKSKGLGKTAILTSILLLFGISASSDANAQNKQYTLEELIALGNRNNKSLQVKKLGVQSAEALKGTVGELPKLALDAELGNYNGPTFDQSYAISQNIPFPTIFKARKGLVEATVQQKKIEVEIEQIEVVKQIRSLYYQIDYLEHNSNQLKYLDSLYKDFIRIATVRYEAGDIKKVEISTAETQQGEIDLLYKQNNVLLKNAYTTLKRLVFVNDDFQIANSDNYSPLTFVEILDSAFIANHPLIRFYEAEVIRQGANSNVIKAEALPDFSIGVTNQSLIGEHEKNGIQKYYGPWNRFTSFTIGVNIPIMYGATKARMKSIAYEKEAAEENAALAKRQLQMDFNNLMNQYTLDVEQYVYYKDQALPNASKIVYASQLGYKTGEISYMEYLYALQTATNIRLKYLESIQRVNESVIQINSNFNQ